MTAIHTPTDPILAKNEILEQKNNLLLKKNFAKFDFGMCMGVYSSEAAWRAGFKAMGGCV